MWPFLAKIYRPQTKSARHPNRDSCRGLARHNWGAGLSRARPGLGQHDLFAWHDWDVSAVVRQAQSTEK